MAAEVTDAGTGPPPCDFCEIVAGRLHAEILFEDESTVAFLDNTAVMEGHTLVIPRAHAADIWAVSEDDAASVMRTAHRMAALLDAAFPSDGLTLFQANRPVGLAGRLPPARPSGPPTGVRPPPPPVDGGTRRPLRPGAHAKTNPCREGGAAPARHPGPVPPPVPVHPQ